MMKQVIDYGHSDKKWSMEDFHLQSSLAGCKEENSVNSGSAAYKPKAAWRNIIIFSLFHLFFIPGIHLALTKAKHQTNLFAFLLYVAAMVGISGGAHRLWSHKSYKAMWQLNAMLLAFFAIAFQGDAWSWARDHRAHHKFQETDADPYNASRGLWFSHIGWLLQSKHPDVIEKGKTIDMSDLDNDPLVTFHKRYYLPLAFLFCFFLPAVIPVYSWGESWTVAMLVAVVVRAVVTYHCTWIVNSTAHAYGNRPYDKFQTGTDNRLASLLTLGEGWHNYHHTFPWDYSASEVGLKAFNFTKGFIDFFAGIGWAYDLKTVSEDVVRKRVLRTGDGTHPTIDKDMVMSWGWDDRGMSRAERSAAIIVRR